MESQSLPSRRSAQVDVQSFVLVGGRIAGLEPARANAAEHRARLINGVGCPAEQSWEAVAESETMGAAQADSHRPHYTQDMAPLRQQDFPMGGGPPNSLTVYQPSPEPQREVPMLDPKASSPAIPQFPSSTPLLPPPSHILSIRQSSRETGTMPPLIGQLEVHLAHQPPFQPPVISRIKTGLSSFDEQESFDFDILELQDIADYLYNLSLRRVQLFVQRKESARQKITRLVKLYLLASPLGDDYLAEAVRAGLGITEKTVSENIVKLLWGVGRKGVERVAAEICELLEKLNLGDPNSPDLARPVVSEMYVAALPEHHEGMPEEPVGEYFGSFEDLRVVTDGVLEARDIRKEFTVESVKDLWLPADGMLEARDIGKELTMESIDEEREVSVGGGDGRTVEIEASRETRDEVTSEKSCKKQREKKQGSKQEGSEGRGTSKTETVENPNSIEDMRAEEVAEMLVRYVCKGLPEDMVHLVESVLRRGAGSYPLYGRSLLNPFESPEELVSILLEGLPKDGGYKGVYHVTVGFIKKAREGKIAASDMGDRGE